MLLTFFSRTTVYLRSKHFPFWIHKYTPNTMWLTLNYYCGSNVTHCTGDRSHNWSAYFVAFYRRSRDGDVLLNIVGCPNRYVCGNPCDNFVNLLDDVVAFADTFIIIIRKTFTSIERFEKKRNSSSSMWNRVHPVVIITSNVALVFALQRSFPSMPKWKA